MDAFIAWVNKELDEKNWGNNELARQMHISSSAVSYVLTGQRKPTWDFCAKLAQAFEEPPLVVFRVAELLPPPPENQQNAEQSLHFFQQLSPENQTAAIAMLRGLAGVRTPRIEPDPIKLDSSEQRVIQILRTLTSREHKSVMRILEELAVPPNDFEILAISPEEHKVLQALGSLQDNDRETIIRMLDSFAKG